MQKQKPTIKKIHLLVHPFHGLTKNSGTGQFYSEYASNINVDPTRFAKTLARAGEN